MIEPLPFQRRFLRSAFAPGTDTAALSLARGNGKSTLAAHILTRAMTPGDPLFADGRELVLLSVSLEQSRAVFNPLREWLEPRGGYRFIDSITRVGITHLPTRTRLRVLSSNPKSAQGIVRTDLLVADEPGAWQTRAGEQMPDAIMTAQGKPDSRLRVLYIGTLAPARDGWWHDLVRDGSGGSVHVTCLQGDPHKWGTWPVIARANPLMWRYRDSRRKLLAERDAARADSRLKARFLSFRLNLPTADESSVLVTADEWARALARPVGARDAGPWVGIDLGGGRSWSAAVGIWDSGRVEALALAPGIPSIEGQERRDRVPTGTYERLVQSGALRIADGLRVQPPAQLMRAIMGEWGPPASITCDRFRLAELQDCTPGIPLDARVSRWSEASADIRALRKLVKDGPLTVERSSRLLITASMAAAVVKSDDAGNSRLVKQTSRNLSRDDVAAALVTAAGAWERRTPVAAGWRFAGIV